MADVDIGPTFGCFDMLVAAILPLNRITCFIKLITDIYRQYNVKPTGLPGARLCIIMLPDSSRNARSILFDRM